MGCHKCLDPNVIIEDINQFGLLFAQPPSYPNPKSAQCSQWQHATSLTHWISGELHLLNFLFKIFSKSSLAVTHKALHKTKPDVNSVKKYEVVTHD